MSDQFTISKLSGFGRGKPQAFTRSEIKIGTAAGSDVRLDATWDKTVAANHATIRNTADGWIYEDHSTQGSFIEGRRVTREKLNPESVVELGKGGPRLKLDFQPARAPAAVPPSAAAPQPIAAARPPGSAGVSVWVRLALRIGLPLLIILILLAAWQRFGIRRSSTQIAGENSAPSASPASTPDQPAAPASPAESPSPAAAGMPDWDLLVDMDERIYPSFLIASVNVSKDFFPFDALNQFRPPRLGDERGIIGIIVQSPAAGTKVRVEIKENELMRDTVCEQVLPEAGKVYRIYPSVAYRFDSLMKVKQTVPLAITAEVSVNGAPAQEKTKTVQVASINDCPFAIQWPWDPQKAHDKQERQVQQIRWMFAAYVNENHPISDELRKEALKSRVVDSFSGNQGGEAEVYKQVFAIWNALRRRGVKYSSITATPEESESVVSQYVRFIDQTINNSQANCADGSVLFASILRQIDIEPILVNYKEPEGGHMFLGFFVDGKGHYDFLETTMIGEPNLQVPDGVEMRGAGGREGEIRQILDPIVNAGLANRASEAVFIAAIQEARIEVARAGGGDAGEAAENDKVAAYVGARSAVQKTDGYDWSPIPVLAARARGVMPIGYQP